jgi:hypothetical protein
VNHVDQLIGPFGALRRETELYPIEFDFNSLIDRVLDNSNGCFQIAGKMLCAEDRPGAVQSFQRFATQAGKSNLTFSPEALRALSTVIPGREIVGAAEQRKASCQHDRREKIN